MDKTILLQSIYKDVLTDFDRLNIPYTRDVPIVINSRAKRRQGCCKKREGKFTIEISEFVLDYPVDEIKNVVFKHKKSSKNAKNVQKNAKNTQESTINKQKSKNYDGEHNTKVFNDIVNCEVAKIEKQI